MNSSSGNQLPDAQKVTDVSSASTIEFNSDFSEAYELIRDTNSPLFITGRAGTGKSTLLKLICRDLLPSAVSLAPTGAAALRVGGQTLHSFFRLPPRLLFPHEAESLSPPRYLQGLENLVIDEVSMVRADLLDAIEAMLRRGGPRPGLPFGGVRLLLFGDLHQLPPVLKSEEMGLFGTWWESPWFFHATCFKRLPLRQIHLRKAYRQRDRPTSPVPYPASWASQACATTVRP